jgi:hypothetical protein
MGHLSFCGWLERRLSEFAGVPPHSSRHYRVRLRMNGARPFRSSHIWRLGIRIPINLWEGLARLRAGVILKLTYREQPELDTPLG